MKDTCIYFTKTKLKERGWTDSLIKKFLPNPDKEIKNPHYKSAPSIKLYEENRIKELEKSSSFKIMFVDVVKKKVSAQKAVETKKEKLINYINLLEFELVTLEKDLLYQKAIQHYNDYQNYLDNLNGERNNWESNQKATIKSEKIFLNRLAVNYARHQLTHYEDILEDVFGKVGKRTAYMEINKKIYDVIGQKYPFLKEECDKQLEMKILLNNIFPPN